MYKRQVFTDIKDNVNDIIGLIDENSHVTSNAVVYLSTGGFTSSLNGTTKITSQSSFDEAYKLNSNHSSLQSILGTNYDTYTPEYDSGSLVHEYQADGAEGTAHVSDEVAKSQGYTVVKTAQEFLDAINSGISTKKIMLGANIDLSGVTNYKPVEFTGILDGNGYVISGLNVSNENGYAVLFSTINRATIKNLGINGAKVSGENSGVIAGQAYDSTIENVFVYQGEVTGTYAAGGLIGTGTNNSIKDTFIVLTSVVSTNASGMVIGYAEADYNTDIELSLIHI